MRETIACDRFPLSRRVRRLKAILAKLYPPAPRSEPIPPPKPRPEGGTREGGRRGGGGGRGGRPAGLAGDGGVGAAVAAGRRDPRRWAYG